MKFTARDRILAMVLPALSIVVGYGVLFSGTAFFGTSHGKLTAAQKALDNARAGAPSGTERFAQQNQLAQLNLEIDKLQAALQASRQQWDLAAGPCADPRLRNERIEKLTNLLARNGLSFLEDGETDTAKDKDLKASPALDPLLKQTAEFHANQKPQLRRLRFHGRYLDVHRALQELAQGTVLAIPVGLTMKEAPNRRDHHEWTLLVWI